MHHDLTMTPVTGESLGLLIEESRTNKMRIVSGLLKWLQLAKQLERSGGFAAPDGSTDASLA